jgi:hypothetical protein
MTCSQPVGASPASQGTSLARPRRSKTRLLRKALAGAAATGTMPEIMAARVFGEYPLEEFKEVARRCNEPTSEKSMAQLQRENVEYEAKGLAYNALIEAIQYAEAEAADRARVKAHEKFYLDREAKIEQQRLAKLREWEEWQVKWREYQFVGGPKPAPLDIE